MDWLIIISFIISIIIWLWVILKYDRYEREPLRVILYVFIVGGIISSFVAGIFNQGFAYLIGFDFRLDETGVQPVANTSLFYAFVGFNEEACKAMVTILLIRRSKRFNEPVDALIYSMTVALGFAVAENIDYTAQFGLNNFLFRQFTAVPLHVGLAAIWGMGLAKAKFLANGKYFWSIIPYLLAASLLHFIYNFGVSWIHNDLLGLILAISIALVVMIFALKRLRYYEEESPFSNKFICHNCNTSNNPGAKFCVQCGQRIRLRFYNICNACNARVGKSASFCPNCGNEIQNKT